MLRQKMLTCCVVLSCACGSLVDVGHRDQKVASLKCGEQNYCDLDQELQALENKKIEAKKSSDVIAYQKLQLEINYLTELRDIAPTNDKVMFEQLQSKYDLLKEILEDDIARYLSKMIDLDSSAIKSYETKNMVFQGPDFTSVYHPLVLAEVKRVFKDFGDLYINQHLDEKGNPKPQEVRVKPSPWSGYWYQFSNKSLYDGEASPLAKFDAVLRKLGHRSRIAEVERERYRGFTPDGWEGLCDAWALAAVVTPEPKREKTVEGIRFSIADLKALQTFSHLKYDKIQYGISYRGDAESDGTFQDIKPEAFHRIVTKVLGREKRGVVIDDMSGVQVWNKPLYRYRWKVRQDPDLDYAFLIDAYPWLIKERHQETDVLTNNRDTIAPVYTYRLYVDKKVVKDGKYKVIAGQWMGDSYNNHPDTVVYPLPKGKLGSHNDEFNKYVDVYQKLFLED